LAVSMRNRDRWLNQNRELAVYNEKVVIHLNLLDKTSH
jgi:hypothetical protein